MIARVQPCVYCVNCVSRSAPVIGADRSDIDGVGTSGLKSIGPLRSKDECRPVRVSERRPVTGAMVNWSSRSGRLRTFISREGLFLYNCQYSPMSSLTSPSPDHNR